MYRTRRMTNRELRRINRICSFVSIILVVATTVILILALTSRQTEAGRRTVPTYKYFTNYTVSSGDTLWSIAEENMTEEYAEVDDYINEVVQINHLTSEYLRPGQNLTVPYYSTEYKD